MGVSIGGAKKKFADIIDGLHSEPPMMSQFAVWLDLKLAEYKLQGDMRLDFHECVSAPDWMKGSKCQCFDRLNGKNQWMYSDTDAGIDRTKLTGPGEFDPGALSLEEFGDPDDLGNPVPDTTIDAQHPLVQLIRQKPKKKTGGGKRGRPKGGAKEGTLTETGVRVKRVKAKRKEPDSFPESTIPTPLQEKKFTPAAEGGPSSSKKVVSSDTSVMSKPDLLTDSSKLLASGNEKKGPLQEHIRPPADFAQPSELPRPQSELKRHPSELGRPQPELQRSSECKQQPPELPRQQSSQLQTRDTAELPQQSSELPRQFSELPRQSSEIQRQQSSEFQRQKHLDFQRQNPADFQRQNPADFQRQNPADFQRRPAAELQRPPPDFSRQPPEFPHEPGDLSDDIPDMSDDELLDSFNDDLDDCSFGSMTPPESGDDLDDLDDHPPLPHPHAHSMVHPHPQSGPGIPTSAPNIRQTFPKSHNLMAGPGAAPYRASQEKGPQLQTNQGYFRPYPSKQERGPSPSQAGQLGSPQPSHLGPQHRAASPLISVQQPTTHNVPPHTTVPPSHQQQQMPIPHSSSQHHQSLTQQVPSSSSPAFPQGPNPSQSSQGSSNTALLRIDRNRTNLTAPQSLLRGSVSDSSNDALKMGMDFDRDPFNDDFYDDDFGTASDEEDLIPLESDEEAAHLAMLEGDLDSPAGSLPEHPPSPRMAIPAQTFSDPENASHTEGAPRKRRKYTKKDDGIKVTKDVRMAVHNVVKDLKSQDELLEWDYTKGYMSEWNHELNSKILSMVQNRLGNADVDACMKATNCYFISRRAQWRKQQNNPGDEGKKKVKQKPKKDVEEPSSSQ